MTKQVINVGTTANDGAGDPLRLAMQKINANTTELYDADVDLLESLDDGLALKANTTDVNTALALKANTSDVTTSLALKANSSDVTTSLALKANVANAALTGVPTAPTAAGATNTTQIATTEFVQTEISSAAADYEQLTNKATNNGYAPLDSSGNVPLVHLPTFGTTNLTDLGAWNASTNSPAISSGLGDPGDYYTVTVAGTTTIDGISQWFVNDTILFDGDQWVKLDNVSVGAVYAGALATDAAPGSGPLNDYAPSGFGSDTGRLDILAASGGTTINGLAAGFDGQQVEIRNTSSADSITLKNQNAGSSAANRFIASSDVIVPPNSRALAIYYAGSINRWSVTSIALAVDQSIAAVWTSDHKWSKTSPRLLFESTDGGTNGKLWDIIVTPTNFQIRSRTDADGTGVLLADLRRTASSTAISEIRWGSGSTTFLWNSTGNFTVNGALIVATAVTLANNITTSAGNVIISQAGKGLQVKEGSNAKMGTATLVAGTVTVATTAVTANSRIFVTSQSDGGTPGFLRVTAKTATTSFVITSSSNTDTSVVAWFIVEPA